MPEPSRSHAACHTCIYIHGYNVNYHFSDLTQTIILRYIIHAVGPTWNGGQNNEKAILNDAIVNIIKRANELDAQSVAIPAISTNIFGFPVKKAIPIIVQAALATPNKSLTEIRFVDVAKNTVDLFVQQIYQMNGFK